jgi:hypothetical protein
VKQKDWDAINYTYSPRYIADNRAQLEAAVNNAVDTFHNHCNDVTLSDEQLIGQQVLDLAGAPISEGRHRAADRGGGVGRLDRFPFWRGERAGAADRAYARANPAGRSG